MFYFSSTPQIPSPLRGRGWAALAVRVRGHVPIFAPLRMYPVQNDRQDTIHIGQHIRVPKSQNRKILPLQIHSALRIPLWRMLPAIQFDNQAQLWAQKIRDIAINLSLAAKFSPANLPIAQAEPQRAFSISGILAQRSCAVFQEMTAGHASFLSPPHPGDAVRRLSLSRNGEREFMCPSLKHRASFAKVSAWVPGEDPDTGPKTNCIIDDLKSQNLQVTH